MPKQKTTPAERAAKALGIPHYTVDVEYGRVPNVRGAGGKLVPEWFTPGANSDETRAVCEVVGKYAQNELKSDVPRQGVLFIFREEHDEGERGRIALAVLPHEV